MKTEIEELLDAANARVVALSAETRRLAGHLDVAEQRTRIELARADAAERALCSQQSMVEAEELACRERDLAKAQLLEARGRYGFVNAEQLAEARTLLGEWTGDETAPGLLRRTTAWLAANPGP